MNGTVAEISIRPLFLILAICAFLSTGWSQTTNTTELTKRLETNLQVKRVDSCKRYTDAYFDGKLIPVVMFEFSIQLRLTIRNLSPEPVMISRRSIDFAELNLMEKDESNGDYHEFSKLRSLHPEQNYSYQDTLVPEDRFISIIKGGETADVGLVARHSVKRDDWRKLAKGIWAKYKLTTWLGTKQLGLDLRIRWKNNGWLALEEIDAGPVFVITDNPEPRDCRIPGDDPPPASKPIVASYLH